MRDINGIGFKHLTDSASGAWYGGTFTDKSTESFSNPQYAYHLGYEHKIDNFNTISSKIGRSFRYPNLDERIGLRHWIYKQHHKF